MAEGAASLWRETYRELRRHAGDARLPFDLRTRLRMAAQRSLDRASTAERRAAPAPFSRLASRHRPPGCLPEESARPMRARAREAGLDLDRPHVALEIRSRVDAFFEAVDYLRSAGYTVVRVGEPAAGPLRRAGVLDVSRLADARALEALLLFTSRFVVCESVRLQHASHAAGAPSLRLNAPDVFSGYPVPGNGVYTLQRAVDLDTGRVLDASDLLTEGYFKNLRNYGHRNNTPAEIRAAIVEMHESVTGGWRDTEAQQRFRTRVIAAGEALAARVPHVAQWGPDRGFIGDGRLARVQAEAW